MNIEQKLKEAARRMRLLALKFDDEAQLARERGFQHWQNETVFPAAVNRLIAAIGAKKWTR